MSLLLSAQNLVRSFDKDGVRRKVVDDISFEIHKGETLGLVGESGCGKSTVAKLIARLTDCDSGKIVYRDNEITKLKGIHLHDYYQEVQMVFQASSGTFDPRKTIGYSIGERLLFSGMKRSDVTQKVSEMLCQLDLDTDIANRYPHQISGGQAQRAQIARALLSSPELLICDEATSALDVTVQKQIVELLKSLAKERGMSMLFISHDLALIQDLCTKALVMHKGKIVETGTPDKIINYPEHENTRFLINSIYPPYHYS